MTKDEEIDDSLEFCRDIYLYLEPVDYTSGFVKNEKAEFSAIARPVGSIPDVRIPDVRGPERKVPDLSAPDDKHSTGRYEETSEERFVMREGVKWVVCILIAFVVAKFLTSYVIQVTTVHGTSMEHTIQEEDRILVDKLWYQFKEPKRFEIIVFTKDGRVNLIKRIIGLPGETIRIKDGEIYIDDNKLIEHFGFEPMDMSGDFEVTLGKDEYFVLGDNRNSSLDSRFSSIGPVQKSEFLGRALVRIYPFNKVKLMS